jgi:5-enolpyruvylshikimate-3-phosphate synthase
MPPPPSTRARLPAPVFSSAAMLLALMIIVSGNNTLQLNLDDLLHASTSTNILKVLGNSGDKVNAAGFSDSTIDKTVDGITYDVYSHGDANTGANVELWVQQEVVLF